MTAVVLSFPQERVYRNRFGQAEARKAYQIVRRRNPKLDPGELWQRTLSAIALAACFRTTAERVTEAAEMERDRKLSALNSYEDKHERERGEKAAKILAAPDVRAKLDSALARLDRIEKEKRVMAELGLDGPPPSAA